MKNPGLQGPRLRAGETRKPRAGRRLYAFMLVELLEIANLPQQCPFSSWRIFVSSKSRARWIGAALEQELGVCCQEQPSGMKSPGLTLVFGAGAWWVTHSE